MTEAELTTPDDFLVVGKISGVFGVKGWVKVYAFTDPRKNVLEYSPLFVKQQGRWVEAKVTGGHVQGKGVVLGLENITDRDDALAQIGSELAIQRKQLKPAKKGEFYWSDLIGLDVVNLQDEALGVVVEMLETGANDVLVVKAEEAGEQVERLIPFVQDVMVMDVDLAAGILRADWQKDY